MKYLIFPLLLCLTACNHDRLEPGPTPQAIDSTAVTPPAPQHQDDSVRYVWVDKLNLRSEPSAKSAVKTQVASGERVALTGGVSSDHLAFVLRGTLYANRSMN